MSKTSHLYRRGNTLYFRLSVPNRFRTILHVSEFTESLRTQSRKAAIPIAYMLAGKAKQLFLYIDSLMIDNDEHDVKIILENLLCDAVEVMQLNDSTLNSKNSGLNLKALMALKKKEFEIDTLKEKLFDQEIENIKLIKDSKTKSKADAFDKLTSLAIVSASVPQQSSNTEKNGGGEAPLLSFAYAEFVKGHLANKKKLGTFGNLFIKGYLGDKKIDLITQKEVNFFFKLLIQVAGGRGGSTETYNKLNIYERVADAEKNNNVLMGLSTFKDTYVGSARQFFNYLKLHYEDYAPIINVEHITYKEFGGMRAKGENKQRALKTSEVERLMDCQPMKDFSKNIRMSHKFWLPMIGLFSGARVNEICQLNPQMDVIKDKSSGIWYFNLTDDYAGVNIEKHHKNDHSKRKVPIHSKLIQCGFLDYFERVRELNHDRIFDAFKPKSSKASYYAEEFFREYLRDIDLYDNVTIGKNVLGMHCLRSSFMSHTVKGLMLSGFTQKQAMSKIQPIVGHCDGLADENGKDLSITASYIDKAILDSVSDNLGELKGVIEALDYAVLFPIASASI
jgi:integrase